MKVESIKICVTCCQINSQSRKSLPFICPRLQIPCLAINPAWLSTEEKLKEMMLEISSRASDDPERIPMDSRIIDREYVESRCRTFDTLQKAGNKNIYRLEAY